MPLEGTQRASMKTDAQSLLYNKQTVFACVLHELFCRPQVAQFSAEVENYPPAIQIYEDVARLSMDNNLLKYAAKGHLLNAGICRLCGEAGKVSPGKVSPGNV